VEVAVILLWIYLIGFAVFLVVPWQRDPWQARLIAAALWPCWLPLVLLLNLA
jgi:hypothetical protein